MSPIYVDHAATTPVRPEVWEAMRPHLDATLYGNPSSIHRFGRETRRALDIERTKLAGMLGAATEEVIFTSGGTEADNLAITGSARASKHIGKHIITSEAEHHAVLHACKQLESEGFEVTYLPVTESGHVTVSSVCEALREDTILVTLMHGNNETGAINPIAEIGELLRERKTTFFHTDAVQTFGILDTDVEALHVDLFSASAHKINGPKGVGLLYIKKKTPLAPLFFGGEQERHLRPGTENVPAIVGLGAAASLIEQEKLERWSKYEQLSEAFIKKLEDEGVVFKQNGSGPRLPHIINLSFPGTRVEPLLAQLDLAGIAASSGSACTAGSIEPSHVLKAMYGNGSERVTSSVRFSFGYGNSKEDGQSAAKKIAVITKKLRAVISKTKRGETS